VCTASIIGAIHKDSAGNIGIGRTNWERTDDQVRKESEEVSHWVKRMGHSLARREELCQTWRKKGKKMATVGLPG
jgi:hypothetical protein